MTQSTVDQRPRSATLSDAVRRVAPALLAYVAVRVTGVGILSIWAWIVGKSPYTLLADRWDAIWYREIAENGYGYALVLEDGTVHSNLAFFPLFPWLERLVAWLTPVDAMAAGLVVSWTCGLVAAWGIFAVAERHWDARVGIVLVALWGALPTALVESMAYTETLFTALCAWTLYALLVDRWIIAGTLSLLAGLTRPTAPAIIATVAITGLVVLIRDVRSGHGLGDLGDVVRRRWNVLVGVAISPLGWLSYVGWVGSQTGHVFGYFDVQAQWDNRIDGGVGFAIRIWELLTEIPPVGLLILGVLALVGLLLYLCVRQKQPLPLLIFTWGLVLLVMMGSGVYSGRARLILPAFPLLLPIAAALGRWRPRRAGVLLGAVSVITGTFAAGLLIYSTAPP